jgi:hypothetical protein
MEAHVIKHSWIVLSLLGITAVPVACSSKSETVAPTPSREVARSQSTVAVNRGIPLSRFVADVAATTEGGECQVRDIPGLGKQIGMIFPSQAAAVREVWLTMGADGNVSNYSDMRGDLVRKGAGPDGGPPQAGQPVTVLPPAGRQTSIHITLHTGWGIAENVGGGKPPVRIASRSELMMNAENLGRPGKMIQLITSRCGK